MATDKKNPAPVTAKTATAGQSFEERYHDWTKHQVGFAPYWNPSAGDWFEGIVMARDDRDPTFVRYLVKATMPMKCKTGPSDSAETVDVAEGEYFTLSSYYQTELFFDKVLLSGVQPIIACQAVSKRKTKESGRSVWTWKVNSHPKYDEQLKQFFASDQAKQLLEGQLARRAAEGAPEEIEEYAEGN